MGIIMTASLGDWEIEEPTPELQGDWEIEKEEEFKPGAKPEWLQRAEKTTFGEKMGELDSFKKGLYSGATFGGTEWIPGNEVSPEDKFAQSGKLIGSFIPIEKLFSVFGKVGDFARKSPILAKQLGALGEITGAGLTGATHAGIESGVKGEIPSTEDLLEHGLDWAVLDTIIKGAGIGGRFAASLLNKSKQVNLPPWKVVNETMTELRKEGVDFNNKEIVAAKALSILEEGIPPSTTDLLSRKIEPRQFDILENGSIDNAEAFKPSDINAEQVFEDLNKSETEKVFDDISPRAESEQQLGENIQNDISEQFSEAEKTYEPIYRDVEQRTEDVMHNPSSTINLVQDILKEINSLKTRPEGYTKVIGSLNDSLSDLGYRVIDTGNKKAVLHGPDGKTIPFGGPIEIAENVPLSKTMELGRRLNKIIDYDLIGPSIKDKLKPVVKSVKKEVAETLGKLDKDLEASWRQAEKNYGEVAQKYGRDSVSKIRGEEATEKIADIIKKPTSIQDMKAILSPKQFKQLERELLEHMNALDHGKAQSFFREIQKHLSDDARYLAKELIKEKGPQSAVNKTKKLQRGIIDELQNSIIDGTRPSKTLELWKTPQGQKIVKDSLRGSPNKAEVLKYLEKQSFHDFTKSFIGPDGKINFKTFNELMKDPAIIENIRLIGGEEAVNFFKNLENTSKKLQRNTETFESLASKGKEVAQKSKKGASERGEYLIKKAEEKRHPYTKRWKDFQDKLGSTNGPIQTTIGVLLSTKLGPLKTAELGAILLGFYKLTKNSQAQKNLIRASNVPKSNLNKFIPYLENTISELSEED